VFYPALQRTPSYRPCQNVGDSIFFVDLVSPSYTRSAWGLPTQLPVHWRINILLLSQWHPSANSHSRASILAPHGMHASHQTRTSYHCRSLVILHLHPTHKLMRVVPTMASSGSQAVVGYSGLLYLQQARSSSRHRCAFRSCRCSLGSRMAYLL
jgi:hypothetical protein